MLIEDFQDVSDWRPGDLQIKAEFSAEKGICTHKGAPSSYIKDVNINTTIFRNLIAKVRGERATVFSIHVFDSKKNDWVYINRREYGEFWQYAPEVWKTFIFPLPKNTTIKAIKLLSSYDYHIPGHLGIGVCYWDILVVKILPVTLGIEFRNILNKVFKL